MPRPILLVNAGSSSLKYQVIDADTEAVTATGLVERVGSSEASLTHSTDGQRHRRDVTAADHVAAFAALVAACEQYGPSLSAVTAVGHRTVHGGDRFKDPVRITADVLDALRQLSPLAPLHNPPAIAGIEAAMAALPQVPQVAVFDTAFFATLPAEAYTYAIDAELASRYGIRKYGFHGTSHKYVSAAVAETLGRDLSELNQIVCHLGNGASVSAIRGGIAIDTSMGLTPLAGLVMGTRSGDVDPGLSAFLAREAAMSVDQVDDMLNRGSGLGGLTGGVSDFRDVEQQMAAGDAAATLAYQVYVHRLVGYIGAYLALLGGVDTLTFTAGVGENSARLREAVCDRLSPLGFLIDPAANQARSTTPRVISQPNSPVTILVVPTNEELEMARQVVRVIAGADAFGS